MGFFVQTTFQDVGTFVGTRVRIRQAGEGVNFLVTAAYRQQDIDLLCSPVNRPDHLFSFIVATGACLCCVEVDAERAMFLPQVSVSC